MYQRKDEDYTTIGESTQNDANDKPMYSASFADETDTTYHVLDEHALDTIVEDTKIQDTGPSYHVLEQHELETVAENVNRQRTHVGYENVAEPVYHDTVVSTVEEWLITLGLSCYIGVFEENGWENLMVLGEMTNADLDRMGVKNINHRSLILSCIEDFKSY